MKGKNKTHICQKPVEVMRWALSVVPESGIVLDPFAGSGSTGEAAALDGLSFIGVECQEDYADMARARIATSQPEPVLF